MKDKKGFVFVETIVVITILVTSLILLYGAFSNVLNIEKERVHYDDTAYVYRTLYLKQFIENNNIKVLYDKVESGGNPNLVSFNCQFDDLIHDEPFIDSEGNVIESDTLNFCESMFSLLNVDTLFLSHYNTSKFKTCTDKTKAECKPLEYVDSKYFDYIKTLQNLSEEGDEVEGYRLLASYKAKDINKDNCNKNDQNECLVYDTNEFYYASLKIKDDNKNKNTHQITFDVKNGESLNKIVNVIDGRSIKVNIIPNNNYLLNDETSIICINGQEVKIVGGQLILENVKNDDYCEVFLSLIKHKVTYFVNNGTSNINEEMVQLGSNGSVIITPNYGYQLPGGTVACTNGQFASISDNTVTVNTVTNNTTCTINPVLKTYNVKVTTDKGSVSPNNAILTHGDSKTFTITPPDGYKLKTSASCTNGQTATISGNNVSVKNVTNNTTCNVLTEISCAYGIGHTWSYSYTGGVQSFNTPCAGTYKLEVWGAQGGQTTGGKGGYATGTKQLSLYTGIYIAIGGYKAYGSNFNGGGEGGSSDNHRGCGGGATHMALTNRGVLSNYNSYRSEVLLVAGGGGGGTYNEGGGNDISASSAYGGSGGGTNGNAGGNSGACGNVLQATNGCFSAMAGGGTQTAGGIAGAGKTNDGYSFNGNAGSFGQGANGDTWRSGGGGGWYGGGSAAVTSYYTAGGGGGSGYIGGVLNGSMSSGNNAGAGRAKITLISYN